jgi:hypothetical protein
MKIVFSEHAKNQVLERNISKKEIISTIENPNKIIKQTQNKFQAVRLIKKNDKNIWS